jgi:hypothetical protein
VNATATAAVLLACLGTGVIYGTDVFCALVLRPAAAAAREASIADLVGRIHHFGDRRLPVPGITAIVAAGTALAVTTDSSARVAVGLALAAMLGWLTIYLRVSSPLNRRLRAAATAVIPRQEIRELQNRWDAVIVARAGLHTLALAGLLTALTVS